MKPIALDGPAAAREREFSGLAWHGDELLLLPQYPHDGTAAGTSQLLRITRPRLLAYLDGADTTPVRAEPVALRGAEPLRAQPGYEGFEAIAVEGERVYLLVETRVAGGHMAGLLVAGAFAPGGGAIELDASSARELDAPTDLPNTAFEALTVTAAGPLVMYEWNGVVGARGAAPYALQFDRALRAVRRVPFPPLAYRVTDATGLDARGRFWVSNYYYPGDAFGAPSDAPPRERDGVERLIELALGADGTVRPTARPPLNLRLAHPPAARNWEGLVRLPGRGFLLVTDLHPATILAFVPFRE